MAHLEALWFSWLALPGKLKILSVATLILVIELGLRYGAPKSVAFARWQAFFKAVGSIWTMVLLALIYLLSVGPISLGVRLFAKDPLDRKLTPEPTLWRAHEPNPLGPEAAARRQF